MKSKNKYIQISCDGGAATGKSTGAKLIAKKYGLKFLSSGLLYRYASYIILKYKPKNENKFINTDNIFGINRLGLSDNYEQGKSLTLGLDYSKEKLDDVNTFFEFNE